VSFAIDPDVVVVDQHDLVAGRSLNVEFDTIDAKLKRFLNRRAAVAGVEVAGAAMSHDLDAHDDRRATRL
jgi:hypothetical protein